MLEATARQTSDNLRQACSVELGPSAVGHPSKLAATVFIVYRRQAAPSSTPDDQMALYASVSLKEPQMANDRRKPPPRRRSPKSELDSPGTIWSWSDDALTATRLEPTTSEVAVEGERARLVDAEKLPESFDAAEGAVKLVVLVSPTCPICLEGIAVVRESLEELGSPEVSVHVRLGPGPQRGHSRGGARLSTTSWRYRPSCPLLGR